MHSNLHWDNPKVVVYCQVGTALDMLDFSVTQAIANTGMSANDFDIVFICWNTSDAVYGYLRDHEYKYVDIEYEPEMGFLWNLYRGWNWGYDVGFEHADYVCPMATDHMFYRDWLKNLYKHAKPNRIVNCNLIESGQVYRGITTRDLGPTTDAGFHHREFGVLAKSISRNRLAMDEPSDAATGDTLFHMPFMIPRDVWDRFGPMAQGYVTESFLGRDVTGDVDFFNRCRRGGVNIVRALDAVCYHYGMAETHRNNHATPNPHRLPYRAIRKIYNSLRKRGGNQS